MNRPNVKDFFADIEQAHNAYLSQPELFRYTQALDNYIDYLEASQEQSPPPVVSHSCTSGNSFCPNCGQNMETKVLHPHCIGDLKTECPYNLPKITFEVPNKTSEPIQRHPSAAKIEDFLKENLELLQIGDVPYDYVIHQGLLRQIADHIAERFLLNSTPTDERSTSGNSVEQDGDLRKANGQEKATDASDSFGLWPF